MKKFFVAMMAVLAIVLSSCKHETCMLKAQNFYSKNVCFIFSKDKACRSIEKSDYYCFVEPGKEAIWTDMKVKGLYAIPYVSLGQVQDGDETLEGFECLGAYDLSEYDGWAIVTVWINDKGMPGFGGDQF